jgi:hypothetical protein
LEGDIPQVFVFTFSRGVLSGAATAIDRQSGRMAVMDDREHLARGPGHTPDAVNIDQVGGVADLAGTELIGEDRGTLPTGIASLGTLIALSSDSATSRARPGPCAPAGTGAS